MCVERLLDTESPTLDTIKMQVFFDLNYAKKGTKINDVK